MRRGHSLSRRHAVNWCWLTTTQISHQFAARLRPYRLGLSAFGDDRPRYQDGGAGNLINCERPVDIYGELARHTEKRFDKSQAGLHWQWFFNKYGGRIRELLKSPGMTFSYAATDRGNIRQVRQALYDIMGEVDRECFNFQTIFYLIECFRAACAEELPGPVQTMEYIQSLVRHATRPSVFWSGQPSGFHFSNDYPKLNTSMVYLPDGTQYTIADGFIPNTIRTEKTVSAAAANFVHSLDATHLVRTVNALAENEMPPYVSTTAIRCSRLMPSNSTSPIGKSCGPCTTKCGNAAARWHSCASRTAMLATSRHRPVTSISRKCRTRHMPAPKERT